MNAFILCLGLCFTLADDEPKLPHGSPAEQFATVRKQLDDARAAFIAKVQAATTNAERDAIMKQAPSPEPFAALMLKIAEQNPRDPAALDALLWVMGNSPSGDLGSLNTKARTFILRDFAESERLAPLAVALAWNANAADEDALRHLRETNRVSAVRASILYALAIQLSRQAQVLEYHEVRLEVAPNSEAKRLINDSLDQDFGKATAERLRSRKASELITEAESILSEIVANANYSDATWPANGGNESIAKLAKLELNVLQTLVPGKNAPETAGEGLSGEMVSLANERGNVVLLTFSGAWCVACRNLYPLERELTKKHTGRPFTIFTVSSDADRDIAKQTLEEEKLNCRVAWDGGGTDGPLAKQWNVRGWPLVVLIDSKGVIRYKIPGAPSAEVLMPLIERLVAEAEGGKDAG